MIKSPDFRTLTHKAVDCCLSGMTYSGFRKKHMSKINLSEGQIKLIFGFFTHYKMRKKGKKSYENV